MKEIKIDDTFCYAGNRQYLCKVAARLGEVIGTVYSSDGGINYGKTLSWSLGLPEGYKSVETCPACHNPKTV